MKEGIIDAAEMIERFQIKDGTPIFIKYYEKGKVHKGFSFSFEKESKIEVLAIKERAEGRLWDCFPEQVGIIDHINSEKGIAHFIVSKKIDSIVKLQLLKERVEIGSRILVKLKKITKDNEAYYVVLTCSLTKQQPAEGLLRAFRGVIVMSGPIGFADDVYIDSSLINENELLDGSSVSGEAILNYNKKKHTWGWKALRINL